MPHGENATSRKCRIEKMTQEINGKGKERKECQMKSM